MQLAASDWLGNVRWHSVILDRAGQIWCRCVSCTCDSLLTVLCVSVVCLQEDERDALHRHQAVFGHHD